MATSGRVITATGVISPDRLGRTLAHEHILLGLPGWEADTLHPIPDDREVVARGVDVVNELKRRGISSFIDPMPGNLGRRLDLSAEVSARTGFNIVCATGLFAEKYGATFYWLFKFELARGVGREADYVRYLADVFINEIENGVGPEKIRCGIIKIASTTHITDYEMATIKAAAIASSETGTPITTHSDDGLIGAEQQRALLSLGVPPHRIIIGHSCNTADRKYHHTIIKNGSYIGFDRFGLELSQRDDVRIGALVDLLNAGGEQYTLISNDSCMTCRDTLYPAYAGDITRTKINPPGHSLVVTDKIIPELRRRGITEEQLNVILVENPRRLFSEVAQKHGSAAPLRPFQ